jgi:hypothetical protein
MTEEQAFIILKQLQDICEDHGLWIKIEWDKQPDLKWVKALISIKID